MDALNSRQSWSKMIVVVLWIIALVAIARLLWCAAGFSRESLQQDFSAFYTAGEALNHGLNPYQNHLNHDPPIWDGMDLFRHSRFLYPPLVATLFQPVALMPYKLAKSLWTFMSLAVLAVSLALMAGITIKERRKMLQGWILPVTLIFAALYHPLLTHLERGQIDTLTLLFLVLAIRDLMKGRDFRAGIWFAFSTLFKLHCLYMVPFLLLRKKWRSIGGYCLCGIVIIVISLTINGSLFVDYLFKELPRISLWGEKGTYDDLLPGVIAAQRSEMLQKNETSKDGSVYRAESFPFEQNASLVRIVSPLLPLPPSAVSVMIFACLFLVIAFFTGSFFEEKKLIETRYLKMNDVTYWQIAMVVILLASPLTWVMNAVWLLPALFLLLRPEETASQYGTIWRCTALLALILAMLPDPYFYDLLPPFGMQATHKYVIAELTLLIVLLGMFNADHPEERA